MQARRNNRLLLEKWLDSPECRQMAGEFKLSQLDYLQELAKNSDDPGNLLEMVLDHCSKNLRKDQGTFYTPRAVAEAMVRRALEKYLQQAPGDLPEKLKNIKILDPACGCGEFLLAALKILLEKYQEIDPDPAGNLARNTRWIIKNNLYGMDCNENALELLRQRLKFIAGTLPEKLHIIAADTLEHADSGKFFKDTDKFHIVIGNPPYVSYGLRNVGKLGKEQDARLRNIFKNSAEYKLNIYALFMEFAINSTCDNGIHSFIVPDSFLTGQYFSKLRNFMLKTCTFREIFFIKQKLFKAAPGSLVIYIAAKNFPEENTTFLSAMVKENSEFILPENGYMMQQNEFAANHRQRFRLFFDGKTHAMVRNIEQQAVCKLGDLLELASGIIGKKGKASIISGHCKSIFCKPGVISGKAIPGNGKVIWDGNYICIDKNLIKSGLKKIDYDAEKIMIRQTGDRIIAGVDKDKLLALNNIHIGNKKLPNLDLERLANYLNSPEMVEYYQAITLESGRAMAQIDLETLRELPMKEFFVQ